MAGSQFSRTGDQACSSCKQSWGHAQMSPEQHVLLSACCLSLDRPEELGWRNSLLMPNCSQTKWFGVGPSFYSSWCPVLLWLSLGMGFKGSGRLLLNLVLLYPLLWAGRLLRQGFWLKGSLAGLYFPSKAVNKPPVLHRVGLSENISLTVSSSFSLGKGWTWRSNLAWKQGTGQAACKPGLWKRDREREQKSSYFRKRGYSLLQISTAAWKNPDKSFCSSADRFAKGALSPLKQQFPNLEETTFPFTEILLKWNDPSLSDVLDACLNKA